MKTGYFTGYFVVCVWFGCNSQEENVVRAFNSSKEALEFFRIYANRVENGERLERLEMHYFPDEDLLKACCRFEFGKAAERV